MVDVIAPVRIEPLIDPMTGNITIRYAEYFDNIANGITELNVSSDQLEGVFSEIQQAQAFTAELVKDLGDIDQLTSLLQNANSQLAEMKKQIEDLNQFIDKDNKSEFAVLSSKINELQELVDRDNKSEFAVLNTRINELQELVE